MTQNRDVQAQFASEIRVAADACQRAIDGLDDDEGMPGVCTYSADQVTFALNHLVEALKLCRLTRAPLIKYKLRQAAETIKLIASCT